MPEFRDDPRARQVYEFEGPSVDLSRDKSKVKMPNLVESVGTDGRFVGAIRLFPGMGDVTVHGLKKGGDSGAAVTWTIANVVLAKYVAIQKGLSEDVLRGIAMLADNQAGTGKSLYFSYVDSSTGTADVVELENYAATSGATSIGESGHRPSTWIDYDIGFSKRYIYLVASCTFPSSGIYPFNRAYWWDFKHNTWETAASGFQKREAGIFYYNRPYTDKEDLNTTDTTNNRLAYTLGDPTAGVSKAGAYTLAVRPKSRKHKLRGRLAKYTTSAADGNSLLLKALKLESPQTGGVFDSTLAYTNSTLRWGLHHLDCLEFYATPVNPVNSAAYQVPGDLQALGELHLLMPMAEKIVLATDTINGLFYRTPDQISGGGLNNASALTDTGVAGVHVRFDPFLDVVGEMPRASRCAWVDDVGFLVTDIIAKASPEVGWYEDNAIADTLRWSSITAGEPENFPVANVYRPDDPGEKFVALEPAGDYLFAVSNNAVYRGLRNGSNFSMTRLQHKLGIKSRYGACGVGQSLFVVTTSGVKEIDGNTGALQSLSQIDRVIFDTLQWGLTLQHVQIEYDAVIGALILLNTSTDQCVLLWEATGAVTRLEDCPFSFLTSGINPKTGDGHRVYFVMADGRTFVVDSERAMSKYAMCAGGSGEAVNAVVTSGSTSTVINFGGQVVPTNCKDFKIYVLTGPRAGESSTITVRNSATQITVSPALTGAPASTDVIAIAPVVFRVQCPQYTGNGIATDTFYSKTLKYVSVSFTNIRRGGGENIQVGAYLRDTKLAGFNVAVDENPDQVVQYIQSASSSATGTQLYPYIECKRADMDFEVQAMKVEGIITGTEQEVRQA